ncbi:hypothetical protein [Amycolatopsis anabasis]|uniref:hypothetical protein n=1 Tax=Amycolatopsis anabasis TaxID=1840409 RepID=UPI00131B8469|nr:hypothetical protein [Amycolatopsis anabasis]
MNTLSLVSAIVSFGSALTTVLLGALFEARRRHGDRLEERRHRVSRYRDPLLQAAALLMGRLANAFNDPKGENRFLLEDDDRHQEYVVYESAYRFAWYLGWVEIMYREARFLDLGSRRRNRRLLELLGGVGGAISRPIEGDQTFRLLGGEQRALGELMTRPAVEGEDRLRCLGYIEFHTRMATDPEFKRWFEPLLRDIARFAADRESGRPRLVEVHNALLNLINFLDPKAVWVVGLERREPLSG